ncbi:unnamed protein product [Candida verbasci]|uniref:Uncharacterized protein n=1 Tax=Candida verbasci TaxID=1227364 RepID=A0A9W4XM59_9ASCO|nr:unnamed protein product [Candida verbasci]
MLKSLLGVSRHSRAFRRAMILEFQPLRAYSETQQQQQKTQTFHEKLQSTKSYLKKLQTEDSEESERMLKKVRKWGVLSVFITLASISIAVYDEHFGEKDEGELKKLEKVPPMELEYIPNLSRDIRHTKD